MKFKINNAGKNIELNLNNKKIVITKNLFFLIIILLLLILIPIALWIGGIIFNIVNIILSALAGIAIIGIILFFIKPELFKK